MGKDLLPLSQREVEILKTLHKFIKDHGYAPILKELVALLDLKAPSTVYEHIQHLEYKGYIEKIPHQERGIRIIEEAYRKVIPSEEQKTGLKKLPVLGYLTVGEPIKPHHNPDFNISVAHTLIEEGKQAFALEIKGNSLQNQGFVDQDFLIIQYQKKVEDGDLVVALLEDKKAVMRKIFFEKDQIKLEAVHSSEKPIFAQEVQVQGKVIGLLRRYT